MTLNNSMVGGSSRPALGRIAISIALVMICARAKAEAAVPLAAVTVTGDRDARKLEVTEIQLDTGSPRSTLTPQAIEKISTPFADYGTLANLTPSFVSSAPNGNGFDAAKNQSLRGFPDGQFNVTIDGIPFADPDGFSHHSTSIFPSSSIGQLVVDRSPGTAVDLGYSTIGGSVNIFSADLPKTSGARAYGSFGSYATSLAGLRLNTAKPTQELDVGLMVNVQHMQSNGAMSNAFGRRDDALLKSEMRFGSAKLTALYSYDVYHFNNPPSVTTDQIARFGPGFGFTDQPGDPTYAGYGATDRTSDFGYLRVQAPLAAGWSMSETLYSYSYKNRGLSLKGDASSATSSNIGNGYGVPATDIGGRVSDNNYRVTGNILQFEQTEPGGTLRGGLWLEQSHQKSFRQALDLITGLPYNANKSANSSYQFDYVSRLETVQPYAEYEWHIDPHWIVKPGLRYQRVERTFDANVVPTSLPGTGGAIKRTVNSTLPSLSAVWAFMPQSSAYAQLSKGALVPNQSFFYTTSPTAGNQAKPQTSHALQVGLRHAGEKWSGSVDAYLMDLNDYVSTVSINGTTHYVNNGKVRYEGIEWEGNAELGIGFSAVGNASLISAKFRQSGMTSAVQLAGDDIPLVPKYVGLLGLLYQRADWTGSLLTKFVGAQFQGKNGSSDGANFRVAPYAYTNLSVGHSVDETLGLRSARWGFQINNIEGRHPVTDTGGPSSAGPLLVNVLAGRNYTLTLSVDL